MSFHSAIAAPGELSAPSLAQSELYFACVKAMGRETCRLPLGAGGTGQVILRRAGPLGRIALMPGGPRWPKNILITERRDALQDLSRRARRYGIGVLVINCGTPVESKILRLQRYLPILTGGFDARLDLTGPRAARRARMQGKWRNRLVRAEAMEIRIDQARFSPDRHRWLLEAEAAQRRARRYRNLPLGFVSAAAHLAPDQVRLFTAMHRGVRLGAMLFVLHDGAASYHIGHLTAQGRKMSAHNLLLWQAASWLAARGMERLDLGPVETERNAGLARFKLGCGAAPVPRGASCLYTPLTAALGRVTAGISGTVVRGFAGRNGRSCR